jgi:hypothetical protein
MQRKSLLVGLSSAILIIFVVKLTLAVPVILDFRNFAFSDPGSFQNLDQLVKQGLHLGVDVGYIYGFLPILLQHIVFALFGTGHWQSLSFLAVDIVLIIVFWILLCRKFGHSWLQLFVLLGLSVFIASRATEALTPAHVILELCLVFSLYCVLEGKLPWALTFAAVGSLAVPSLPLVLGGLLSLVIVWEWWEQAPRTARGLVTAFAPAAITYFGIVAVLTALYSWKSVIPSLLPLRGVAEYRAMHFGFFSAGKVGDRYWGGRAFWDPPHAHFTYYLDSKAGVWMFCSVLLAVFGFGAALQMVRTRTLSPRALFVVLCCLLHFFFVFFGFAGPYSSVYYETILAAGVFAGFSSLTDQRVRIAVCSVLLVLGLLGQKYETQDQLDAWRLRHRSDVAASLYVPKNFDKEWQSILALAKNQNLFLLAYGNGASHYYPRVQMAESWMLMPGVPVPREDAFVLQKLRSADVVVQETEWGVPLYIDGNREWQEVLAQFPVKTSGNYFRVWMKNGVAPSALRPAQQDLGFVPPHSGKER